MCVPNLVRIGPQTATCIRLEGYTHTHTHTLLYGYRLWKDSVVMTISVLTAVKSRTILVVRRSVLGVGWAILRGFTACLSN